MTYSVIKSKVCSYIAGVKCNNHIHIALIKLTLGYIVNIKLKVTVAVSFSNLVAVFHYVFLKVVTDYLRLYLFDFGEVVIHNKGEVGFTATEIENCNFVFIKLSESIVNYFNKAVYLLEFGLLFV